MVYHYASSSKNYLHNNLDSTLCVCHLQFVYMGRHGNLKLVTCSDTPRRQMDRLIWVWYVLSAMHNQSHHLYKTSFS